MVDPYAPLCIHGTLPLVREEGHAAGIRFARIGRDAPDACIFCVADLPDAHLELRVFRSAEMAKLFADTAIEFGGNTVACIRPEEGDKRCVLVVRHDRERMPGNTPDEVIHLVGTAPDAGKERARLAEAAKTDDAYRKWKASWKDIIDVLSGSADVKPVLVSTKKDVDAPLQIDVRDEGGILGGSQIELVRTAAGPIARMRIHRHGFDDRDLSSAWTRSLTDNDVTPSPPYLTTVPKSLDPAGLIDAAVRLGRAETTERELRPRQNILTEYEKTRSDRYAMAALERLVQGCLLVYRGYAMSGEQLSPLDFDLGTVPARVVQDAMRNGLIDKVWEPSLNARDATANAPTFFGLTVRGRMLLNGDRESFVDSVENAKPERDDANRSRRGKFASILRDYALSVGIMIPGDALERLNGRIGRTLEVASDRRTTAPWCIAGMAAQAGLIVDGPKPAVFPRNGTPVDHLGSADIASR